MELTFEIEPLLKPISEDNPVGDDLKDHDNRVLSAKFAAVAEVFQKNSLTEEDLVRIAEDGPELLANHSKDLRVAVAICLLWLKRGGAQYSIVENMPLSP